MPMEQVGITQINILSRDGQTVGVFNLATLPQHEQTNPILDFRNDPDRHKSLEPVQIIEGGEYRYQIDIPAQGSINVDRQELFAPDDQTGKSGRLKPGLHVGGLPVNFFVAGQLFGSIKLEVISRKLDYLSHYRWMLRDISTISTDIIIHNFAPALQTFAPDNARDPQTIYQKFAFLYSLITSANFEIAINQILSKPHRTWIETPQAQLTQMGVKRGDSQVVRSLTRSRHRQPWGSSPIASMTSIPVKITTNKPVEILDTVENRFIKFALEQWKSTTHQVQQILEKRRSTYAIQRGLREVSEVLDLLDNILKRDFFIGISQLSYFPASSTVLHQKEGYREIFNAYIQSEAAARLKWEGSEDVFGAGQRDVATLYENWTFFQLVKIIAAICKQSTVDFSELIAPTADGYSIQLKRGKIILISGNIERFNRRLSVELYYNKTFSAKSDSHEDGSWSKNMRPDYSIKFILAPAIGNRLNETVWLHFDAKYRVNNATEIFGEDVPEEEYSKRGSDIRYKSPDLLIMHTYKDAVRHSEGAYIIYPGNAPENTVFLRYCEKLPSIGAFPLLPDEIGDPHGNQQLSAFFNSIVDTLALQSTKGERGRFWNREIFENSLDTKTTMNAVNFLEYPPEDSQAIMAVIKSQPLYNWILKHRLLILDTNVENKVSINTSKLSSKYVLIVAPGISHQIWSLDGQAKLLFTEDIQGSGLPLSNITSVFVIGLQDQVTTLTRLTESEAYKDFIPDQSHPSDYYISSAIKLSDLLTVTY